MDRNRFRTRAEPAADSPASGVRDAGTARPGEPIAIVGMAAHFGPLSDLRPFSSGSCGGSRPDPPAEPRRWWGLPQTAWHRDHHPDAQAFRGYYLDSFRLRVDRFRIPPRELEEMLPQQSLMLKVAAPSHRGRPLESGSRPQDRRPDRPGSGSEHGKLPASLAAGRQVPAWNESLRARPFPAPG